MLDAHQSTRGVTIAVKARVHELQYDHAARKALALIRINLTPQRGEVAISWTSAGRIRCLR